jgi:outer membrane protein, multidrug efflux system
MTGNGRRSASSFGMAALVVLTACAADTPYTGPQFGFLTGYRAAPPGAPILLSNDAWWQDLNDPLLDRLIMLALQDSPSIEIARERIIAARAELRAVPGAAILTTTTDLQAQGDQTGPDLVGSAALGLTWMLDPYGARRGQLRVAGAEIEVATAELDAARLLLLYNMANAYAELRYRQTLVALGRAELAGRQQTLALMRQLQDAESATWLEITRSQARISEVEATLPGLQADVTAKQNEIAVLAGFAPGTLPGDLGAGLATPAVQPRPRLSPDVGIPADLLRNRPDIRIAERRYYAALSTIDVARADLYPRLSLTGAISLDTLGGGIEYFFGPVLQFPNLPLGQAQGGVAARESEARQAHAAWRATVTNALLEVENALVTYQASSLSVQSAQQASRLYAESYDLMRQVFTAGEATLTDLIDVEQSRASSDRQLADLQLQYALQFIALNVRLGAGHAVDDPGPLPVSGPVPAPVSGPVPAN